jgi:hypothetical protein
MIPWLDSCDLKCKCNPKADDCDEIHTVEWMSQVCASSQLRFMMAPSSVRSAHWRLMERCGGEKRCRIMIVCKIVTCRGGWVLSFSDCGPSSPARERIRGCDTNCGVLTTNIWRYIRRCSCLNIIRSRSTIHPANCGSRILSSQCIRSFHGAARRLWAGSSSRGVLQNYCTWSRSAFFSIYFQDAGWIENKSGDNDSSNRLQTTISLLSRVRTCRTQIRQGDNSLPRMSPNRASLGGCRHSVLLVLSRILSGRWWQVRWLAQWPCN